MFRYGFRSMMVKNIRESWYEFNLDYHSYRYDWGQFPSECGSPVGFYVEAVVIINLLILALAFFAFRRDPFIDMRANMLFMIGLTVINIMTELGMMSTTLSWVAFGALFIWSMMGGGRSR